MMLKFFLRMLLLANSAGKNLRNLIDLQQLNRYRSACLGIRKGVMVVQEVIAAGGGDGLELMVGKTAAEMLSGCCQGIVEFIVGIVHLIDPEYGLQASLVETGIVRH